MKIKKLILFLGSILIIVLLTLGLFEITLNLSNSRKKIFVDFVRYEPKRIRGACLGKVFPWPDFASIKRVIFSQSQKGIYQIRFETYAPIPTDTKDILCFLAFFDTPSIYGIWDTGVIYASKNYPFLSKPPSLEGGVFRDPDPYNPPIWIGDIKASVKGSIVEVEFDSKLVENSKELVLVIAVYLPSDIKLPKGCSIWSAAQHDVLRIDPRLRKAQIMIPRHP